MGLAPSLVAQQLASFDLGLLELDTIGFGNLDHLGPGGLQQLAVSGMSHRLLLHGGVHDHAGQLFLGDQLEANRRQHCAGQQLFHAFFAQSFTEALQFCGGTRPLVLKILLARKVLTGGGLARERDYVLVTLVERMLDVKQRHHQTGGQTRTPGIRDATNVNGRDRAK
jgi:hypothetical protein